MNVQAVVRDMKRILPEKRDTITKDTPVYRVLKHHQLHPSVIMLALALGESRLLRHLNKLSIDRDFIDQGARGLNMNTSIGRSDFYRSIYLELVGKEQLILDVLTYGDVHVGIDIRGDRPKSLKCYGSVICVPTIVFLTSDKAIHITRGAITVYDNM